MTFLALDKPARPTGLQISSDTVLIDTAADLAKNQVDTAGWFDCAPASPLASNPTLWDPVTGHDALRVQVEGRPFSATAEFGACLSPKSKASPCVSPKHAAAAAVLKSLQRTPVPLILARMKVLLERLNMLMADGSCVSATTAPAHATAAAGQRPGTPKSPAAAGRSPNSFFASGLHASKPTSTISRPSTALATSRQPAIGAAAAAQKSRPATAGASSSSTPVAGNAGMQARGSTGYRSSTDYRSSIDYRGSTGGRSSSGVAARKPVKLIEVSTTGGLAQSIMQQSAQSVLDELVVTLGFVSEFLAGLSPDTRKALASVARLENYKKDQMIFDIGDEPSHFYVILSGRIDIWSHPPGAQKPKSIVSVLRRGDAFGDQAIINAEPHGTAASPATNVTLLVVTSEDFMAVLGAHFLEVAAEWQHFLINQVAPMADCDPAMVRRLCPMLVSEKPADGQECSVHEDQVCFIQAGTFEVRLVDLQAQQAAEAALAAAIASASSALPIAPIPEHLRLGPGGMHISKNSIKQRRPTSAPPGAQRPQSAAAAVGLTGKAVGAAGQLGETQPPRSAAAQGGAVAAAAGGASSSSSQGAAGIAAGLDMLQEGLADCPALGTEGVLATVRIKNGRLVGTQGLAKKLRKQHGTHVPYKVIAELGPGGWFGGGEAIYGSGPLQSALQVVAVGADCAVVHAHLSGLQKHGGPELIKRLRDDAAFKLTYHLGRAGVLPPHGAAVGHPESTLVSQAVAIAAAAALETAGLSVRGPGGFAAAAAAAAAVPSFGPSGLSSTLRNRPASAAAGGSSGANKSRRGTGTLPEATVGGAAAASRPASAAKGGSRAAALRRSSSTGSTISSAWDDAQIGVMPPSAGEAATAALKAPAVPAVPTAAAAPAGIPLDASLLSGSFLPRATRARQKRVHVPGSGVFGPGVMSALQHIQAIQAADAAAAAGALDAAASSGDCGRSVLSSSRNPPPAAAAADVPVASGMSPRRSMMFVVPGAAAGSLLSDVAAAAAAAAGPSQASGCQGGGGGYGVRPRSACARAGTAADMYWQQPNHSTTATGTALSGLLPTLFSDGLQPLVSELDSLLSQAGHPQHTPLLLQQQQQQQHMQADSIAQLQQQRLDAPYQQQDCQQPGRPASAAARLQQPVRGSTPERHGMNKSVMWGRQQQQQHVGSGSLNWRQQLESEQEVLRHKPTANLLAASVMWQRSSAASFRPPLRQCLTSAEIARQRNATADEDGIL